MKKNLFAWAVACMLAAGEAGAQNPIIQTRYTADPAACVYGDTLYLYTSVDNE